MRLMRNIGLTFLAAMILLAVPVQGQVIINEIDMGPTDWLELHNTGVAAVNLNGWQVLVSGDNNGAAVTASFTFGNVSIAPGEFIVVTENSALSAPVVPPGTQILYFGGNIFWHSFNVGSGGTCTLTDGVNGIDTVNWLSPLNSNPVPPANFSPSIGGPLTGNVLYRTNLGATSTAADWVSDGNNTAGAFNPGQQILPSISIAMSVPMTGQFQIDVTTADPPATIEQIYNLFSAETQVPTGSGQLFGIGMDAFPQIFVDAAPFRTYLSAGSFQAIYSLSLPPGTHVEAVSIMISAGTIARISEVSLFDF